MVCGSGKAGGGVSLLDEIKSITCCACDDYSGAHDMDACMMIWKPKIVAALEAAERVAQVEPTYSYRYYGSDKTDCLHCDGFEGDSRIGYRFIHETDCQHQALVAALEGES
jgi:hypothetical protein